VKGISLKIQTFLSGNDEQLTSVGTSEEFNKSALYSITDTSAISLNVFIFTSFKPTALEPSCKKKKTKQKPPREMWECEYVPERT
jgi:hypothetical protein